MFKKMDSMKYRPFMIINATVDVCALMGRKFTSPLTNMFAKSLAAYSNVLEPCPRRGHIYVKDHIEDPERFPSIIPVGDYHTHIIHYTRYNNVDHVLFQMITHFEVVPVGIERF